MPSPEVHETISRAWQLHQRAAREAHEGEMERKYQSLRSALALLEETDADLFEKAVGGRKFQNVTQKGSNARLEGLVPRELRVPMERPSSKVWDGTWQAVVRETK